VTAAGTRHYDRVEDCCSASARRRSTRPASATAGPGEGEIASSSICAKRVRLALLLGVLAAAALSSGCGITPGEPPGAGVGLTVTRDFGTRSLVDRPRAKVAASDTVMRMLGRNAKVAKRSGGLVQDINGVARGLRDGRPVGWSFYVNGVESDKGAAAVDVHGGDRIWWDRHDLSEAPDVPAVVGSFPEPFLHGRAGRRLPVRVECADTSSKSCDRVAKELIGRGIPVGRSSLSHSSADETLRVLVGPWKQLRGRDVEADNLDSGPRASGVFARFDEPAAARLVVLDERGQPARTLGAGSGLVAATRAEDRQPVWYVTGTDEAGVAAAARAFDESVLADNFALAIANDLPVRVPLTETGGAAKQP